MLEDILRESARRHKHLCPRQVLGARMALYAGELLNLDLPRNDKRLLVIAETDGCAVDGIGAATGCHVGGRTLRIADLGKVAATFTDTHAETSLRIAPSSASRPLALDYFPESKNRWQAMLNAYQVIPAAELFIVQRVNLITPVDAIVSSPNKKAMCEVCGEEIFNGREVLHDGMILCKPCVGEGYYYFSEVALRSLK